MSMQVTIPSRASEVNAALALAIDNMERGCSTTDLAVLAWQALFTAGMSGESLASLVRLLEREGLAGSWMLARQASVDAQVAAAKEGA